MENTVFKISEAVSTQGGAMEADTISKHGRSSKSQMSRGYFLRKTCFVLLIVFSVFSFYSCEGEEKDDEKEGEILKEMLGTWHLKKYESTDADMTMDTEAVATVSFTLYNNRTYSGNPCSTNDYSGNDNNKTWKYLGNLIEFRNYDRITYRATLRDSELIIETLEEWDWYGKWTYSREPVQLPPFPISSEIISYKGDFSLFHGTWLLKNYELYTPESSLCEIVSFNASYNGKRSTITVNSDNSFLMNNLVTVEIFDEDKKAIILDYTSYKVPVLFTFNSAAETLTSPNVEEKYKIEAASNETRLVISSVFSEEISDELFIRFIFSR